MQKNFIQQIENQSKDDVNKKNDVINNLMDEMSGYMKKTEYLDEEVKATQLSIQSFEGATSKLKEYGNINHIRKRMAINMTMKTHLNRRLLIIMTMR